MRKREDGRRYSVRWAGSVVTASFAALLFSAPPSAASNLVINGDFSAGNSGFTSGYLYSTNNSSPGALEPENTYFVGTNPSQYNIYWNPSAANFGPPASAPGGSQIMMVNGGPVPGTSVWSETGITVTPNTTYFFSAYVASIYQLSPAKLNFSVNGGPLGSTFLASTTIGLWQEFFTTWNSGSNTTASLGLVDQNTARDGNDFALDLISLNTAPSGGTNVSATPLPSTWTMLIAGFVGLGFLAFRGTKKGAVAIAAA